MKRLAWVLFGLHTAAAAQWQFAPAVAVVDAGPAFVHVESAGRKNIAVSGRQVAVVWDDDRSGLPECRLALKAVDRPRFGEPWRLSLGRECAEPVLVALGAGRFLAGWEEDGRLWLRGLTPAGLGRPLALAGPSAVQLSLGFHRETGVFAAWSERRDGIWRIRLAALDRTGRPRQTVTVDEAAQGDQSYPSLAVLAGGRLVVAWEDRRAGHTRIHYAVSRDGGRHFSTPRPLNESEWRGQGLGLGRGTGVMRVALSPWGEGVAAVWADKRDFPSGYDVYGAFAGRDLVFGANEKVQDPFGDNIAQWHPAIAADRQGRVAVVWDDDRDGTPDVWLSWKTGEGWSDDLAVPGASGPGVQSDPAIAMDEAGHLHILFVDKPGLGASGTLRYVFGRALSAVGPAPAPDVRWPRESSRSVPQKR